MTDVQGFYADITLDTETITAYCNDVSIERTKTVQTKPTMDGTGVPLKLVTQKDGTMSLNGQIDTAGHQILEATFAKDVAVAAVVAIGDGAAIDAGRYAGDVTLNGSTVAATADGTWDFTLSADGLLVYTPPA